jgi:hypothetical protein
MSNVAAAELVTVTLAGYPIRAEITDILNCYREDGALKVEVRLTDGTAVQETEALDLDVALSRGPRAHRRPTGRLVAHPENRPRTQGEHSDRHSSTSRPRA